MIFGRYSDLYDTFYAEKDYEAECGFLEAIFSDSTKRPVRTIVDLGCGTGGHAIPLALRGFEVTGVDMSQCMLEKARLKACSAGVAISLHMGDITRLNIGRSFDAAIAMFTVIGYQTTNEALRATFDAVRRHLEPGGLFVFDCWYGPAVLALGATARCKVIEVFGERIVRYATPTLNVLDHTVRVDYKIVRSRERQILDEFDESHLVRFMFPQEIRALLGDGGFTLEKMCPFLKLSSEITDRDWTVSVVGKAL